MVLGSSLLTRAADENLRLIRAVTRLLPADWASKTESALRIFGADRALLLVEGIALAKLIMLAVATPSAAAGLNRGAHDRLRRARTHRVRWRIVNRGRWWLFAVRDRYRRWRLRYRRRQGRVWRRHRRRSRRGSGLWTLRTHMTANATRPTTIPLNAADLAFIGVGPHTTEQGSIPQLRH